MEKQRIVFTEIGTIGDCWAPTNNFRWLEKETQIDALKYKIERVLQQKWQSNFGAIKWEDVPIEVEEK